MKIKKTKQNIWHNLDCYKIVGNYICSGYHSSLKEEMLNNKVATLYIIVRMEPFGR